jgi:3-phenylpropionate/trans-cinnamate dioxygenase ferredoxin reductase component
LPAAVRDDIRELHESHNIDFRLGEKVTGLERTGNGRLDGVATESGRVIPTSTVLFATGCVPQTEWLEGTEWDLTNGVACDAYGRVAPTVWAAGDIARWAHPFLGRMRLEHRTNATLMGMAVARNIAATLSGAALQAYDAIPYFWTDQHGVRLQVFGECLSSPLLAKLGSFAKGDALALFGSRTSIQGVVAAGRNRDFNRLRHAVTRSAHGEDVSEVVGEFVGDYAPL